MRFLISPRTAASCGLGHGDAHHLAAGLFEAMDLGDGGLDVVGVGRGHRLHPDRVVAADDLVADLALRGSCGAILRILADSAWSVAVSTLVVMETPFSCKTDRILAFAVILISRQAPSQGKPGPGLLPQVYARRNRHGDT